VSLPEPLVNVNVPSRVVPLVDSSCPRQPDHAQRISSTVQRRRIPQAICRPLSGFPSARFTSGGFATHRLAEQGSSATLLYQWIKRKLTHASYRVGKRSQGFSLSPLGLSSAGQNRECRCRARGATWWHHRRNCDVLPPVADQLILVSAVPLTLAVNCCVPPISNEAVIEVTDTAGVGW
jgi:hypothetical protein